MTDDDKLAHEGGATTSRVECRALVVLDRANGTRPEERPSAGFLTHLIACQRRLPAFRRAGRAQPAAAIVVYGQGEGRGRSRVDLSV